jgi:hypothetical protein
LCKHCTAADTERKQQHHRKQNEAHRNAPLALAKWVEDDGLRGLVCPRCGIAEPVSRV